MLTVRRIEEIQQEAMSEAIAPRLTNIHLEAGYSMASRKVDTAVQ